MRTIHGAFRFLDSAAVPAEVFSSLMKKMTAPTMKRRDNIPYSKVIFRIPSEGNQESFFILDIES